MTPRATYRLQLHKGFTFDDAVAVVPYLARLGVSHVYASPFLMAHPGSTHGYDIVDHARINPELGGLEGFDRLSAALSGAGLGLILDFVPNHMGVGGADNAVWLDLLEWGQEADHAGWFDIDWTPDRTDLRDRVLVPFLGGQFGAVLADGGLVLKFDAIEGSFAVWAHEAHKLPICPLDYAEILGRANPQLEILGDAFADLMRWRPQIMRRARTLKESLATLVGSNPEAARAVDDAVALLNEPFAANRDRLHALIDRQNWKVTHHLVAGDDINYRRFFNIATLAGLRMELPEVFDRTHRLVFDLIGQGRLHGLRLDHIDGLFDPKEYLQSLRRAAPRLADGTPPYLVVEKILGADEPLRPDWPIDGTTGYEFTNLLTGLFIQTESAGAFTSLYGRFTGESRPFDEVVLSGKLQIIDDEMSSELHRLARAATRVARQNGRTADFTLTVLQRALRQIVAAFPVYRTYIDAEDAPTAADLADLDLAVTAAAANDRGVDASVFAFLRELLSGRLLDPRGRGYRRADVFRCAMKFQQYCGPVMAKGVEDTAFYRYNRFVALNEVGGAPDRFGVTVEAFHAANTERANRWPTTMLATSTHDTKRGEDTRARLAALSTMPERWSDLVERWSGLLAQHGAVGPDRNDEYLVYQLLVGTWPVEALDPAGPNEPGLIDDYATRVKAVMTKSIREAKVHSTWVSPDEAYEAATLDFVERALRGPAARDVWTAGGALIDDAARLGAEMSFAQTVLKLTVPGMPDIYQGADLWDLSMVDPDNRRPVDFNRRAASLSDIEHRLAADPAGTMAGLMDDWHDGRFKLAITARLLEARRRHPALFASGAYTPLAIEGRGAEGLVGFVRTAPGTALVVLARRSPVVNGEAAQVTMAAPVNGRAVDLLAGRSVDMTEMMSAAELLGGLPATAMLIEVE